MLVEGGIQWAEQVGDRQQELVEGSRQGLLGEEVEVGSFPPDMLEYIQVHLEGEEQLLPYSVKKLVD